MFRGRGVHPSWPARLAAAQRQTTYTIEGQAVPRIRFGSEGRRWPREDGPCHDCAALKGEFHVPGCDMERCAVCRGQVITCRCAREEELE
jgi:hypothetical protein